MTKAEMVFEKPTGAAASRRKLY